jgi:ATP/maltotriose-dependent transcriptional regulator MalT
MRYTQGELAGARTGLTQALALARSAPDLDSAVHAEFLLGHVELAANDLDAARNWFTRSLEGFKAAASAWGTGHVLTAMAWLALAIGDTREAERRLDEAASALRHAGPWFLSLGTYIRAIVAVRRGAPDEAIALVRESLARIRKLQDKFALVYVLVPLVAAAALKGDDMWAARILGARDAVTDRTGAAFVDHSVQDLRERAERDVRSRLGPERWARAYAAGRKASLDSLLEDIDRTLSSRAQP